MTIARVPLTHPLASRTASMSKDSRCVNAMFETSGEVRWAVKRPGLIKQNYDLPVATGRGLFSWDSTFVVAQETSLLSAANNTYTTLGSLTGTKPLSFVQTREGTYLAFHDGASLYHIDKATKTMLSPAGTVASVTIDTAGGYYGYQVACTVAFGATTTVTKVGHGLVDGQGITFVGTTLPSGIEAFVTYQVRYVDADSFTVNTVSHGGGVGSAVVTTTTGTDVLYEASPTVTFSAGTITALGTAKLYQHGVSEVVLTQVGNYTDTPTVTFSDPPALTDTAEVTVNYYVISPYGYISGFNITNGGAGYMSPPSISFTRGVSAYTTLTNGAVTGITLTSVGYYAGGPSAGDWSIYATIAAPTAGVTALGTVAMSAGSVVGPFAHGIEYLDGYVFVLTEAGRLYQSDLEDPTTWGALNFIEVNADPDSAVALVRQLNYLVAFNKWSTEVFYNAGNTSGSILNNNKSAKLEIGCASGPSVAKAEHTVAWVGQSKTEGKGVYLLEGLSPVRVSNRYVDKYLNASTLDEVYSYCVKVSGHTLYVLTLEDLNITLVYDIDEKEWYPWTSQAAGVESYFQMTAYNGNLDYASAIYLQHHTDGQIYVMSSEATADDTNSIYYRLVTNLQDSGTTKRKFYIRAELVGDKVAGSAQIRHTSNDYQTWSSYRTVDLSAKRPILYQLGESRRRAWEILVTDNIPVRLEALELDFDVGEIGAS